MDIDVDVSGVKELRHGKGTIIADLSGIYYDVPLQRLPQQRDIFSTLKSFKDVRAFYARESEEKGQPAVEG